VGVYCGKAVNGLFYGLYGCFGQIGSGKRVEFDVNSVISAWVSNVFHMDFFTLFPCVFVGFLFLMFVYVDEAWLVVGGFCLGGKG